MAERKIEIQMAAVNAAETAADITKSTDAVDGLTKATDENTDAAAKRAEQVRQSAVDEVEGLRKAQEADRSAMREKIQATAAITAAFSYAKQQISAVAEALNEVDMEQALRVDPKGAEELEKMSFWLNLMDSPVKTITDGLSKWVTGDTVSGAFSDMNAALENAAKDHEATVDRMIQSGVRQTDEIKRLADEVKAANAILDAKDDADSAARDRADDAAVRGGADPKRTEAARVRYDEERKMAKLQRELDQVATVAWDAASDANWAGENFDRVSDDPTATRADVEKARAAKKAANDAAEKTARDRDNFAGVASHRARKIREEAAGNIERISGEEADLVFRQVEAEQKAAEQKAEQEARAKQREAAAAARQEAQREAAAQRTARGAFGVADDAEGLGAGAGGIARLRQQAAAVQANPTAANNAELVTMVKQLLNHFETTGNQTDAKIRELKGEVNALLRREKLK